MRDELEIKLINLMTPYVSASESQELRWKICMVLADYEIGARKTELAVIDEEKNDAIIKRFLATKMASGRSHKTLVYYKQCCDLFFSRVCKDYDTVTADDIRKYLAARLAVDKVTKTTANNERRCVSAFYSWCQREELISKNPMLRVDPIKVKKEKKKAFSDMEIEKLRNACLTNRERALVEVLISTWCRVSEVAQIQLTEINGDEILVHGKGDKDRIVYLNAKAQIALENYRKERKDDNPYLFPKSALHFGADHTGRDWYMQKRLVDPNEHANNSSLEHMILTLSRRCEVQNAHPHRFRRTGATMALQAGMPLITVSKLLGHANIGVTQIYLDISDDELADAHRKYVK